MLKLLRSRTSGGRFFVITKGDFSTLKYFSDKDSGGRLFNLKVGRFILINLHVLHP